MMQRSSIFSFESLPVLGLDRRHAPWGLLFALFLLALVEFGVARRDFIWGWVPHSDTGVVDVLEERVLHPDEEGQAPRIVFFGNSRMRDGVAPRTLEERLRLPRGSVMNLSLTQGNAYDAEMLYERNRELLRHARVVVLGVDVMQLDGSLPLNERVRRFAPLGDRALRFEGSERIELVVGWFWRSYDARDAMRRFIKTAWKDKPEGLPLTEDGRVEWRTDAVNRIASRGSPLAYAVKRFSRYEQSVSRRRQLREFVELVESDGIEVVIVQVPVRSEFISEVRQHFPTHLMEYEDDVMRSVGDRRKRIWWDSEFVGLKRGHFYDYGHLRDAGTQIFTRKLADYLREEFGTSLQTPRGGEPRASKQGQLQAAVEE